MFTVVVGTRAQVIKMAPVMRELEAREIEYDLILTGQHRLTINELLDEFKISTIPTYLHDGKEVDSIRGVIPWIFRIMKALNNLPGSQRNEVDVSTDIYLVHGDTFSTLVGLYIAKKRKSLVAHIESGLRSGSLINPFPEEIIRRIVARFCNIAFAPGKWACENLAGASCTVINTEENTILDTMRFAIETDSTQHGDAKVLFSIHRFETLYSRSRMKMVIDFITTISHVERIIFVTHPATEKRLKKTGYYEILEKNPNVLLQPRMNYVPFINLASRMKLVVTDGGSNQEELSYLGIPVLLMRMTTERLEGIGKNVLLGEFEWNRMEKFAYCSLDSQKAVSCISVSATPSKTIVDYLENLDPGIQNPTS